MARFNYKEADNYGGSGGSGFFYLRDDGDCAKVRFLYNNVNDVMGYSVHEVMIGDKKRYVSCLREYNQPVDVCPFCKNGMHVMAKLIIPIYDFNDDSVKIWERGKKFFGQMAGLCSKYNRYPIVSQTFEIERHGAKGDTGTTYVFYPTQEPADDTTLDDFDMPNIEGPKGFILTKSTEDMQYYVEKHHFPTDDSEEAPRRTSRRVESEDEMPTRRTGRRTPAGHDVF